jgi:lysylphosphatidylglycerol synthetase-like protein (DUF2156 family)
MTEKNSDPRPVRFKLAYWWSFGFAAVFLLYGAVTLVLGFLDRQYGGLAEPFGFLLIGILLITVAYGLRSRKGWAWYGAIVINGLIIVLAAIGFRHYANLIILVLAAAALVLLLSSDTKRYLFHGR